MEKITFPSAKKIAKHFAIVMVGMIILIIFFIIIDSIIDLGLNPIYSLSTVVN